MKKIDSVQLWNKHGKELVWSSPWNKTYKDNQWFKGGKLNLCYNCLDRHLSDKCAVIWVPDSIDKKSVKISYNELHEKVCRFSNVLKKHGIKKGDFVTIYLPLIPEAIISMLACTRIGAIHSVVFSAFSADALKLRINDVKSKLLVTTDKYYRRGKEENLLERAKEAIKETTIEKMILVSDNFYEDVSNICEPEIMNSEDILFLLHTSGTTGKPKGIIHDTGGYAVQTYWTTKQIFNIHDDDIMWCTGDIGWITGHTYALYGPLLNGITTLIYEGTLDDDRWWKIIEEFKPTIFYTTPTAIRMFMKQDIDFKKFNLSSLRILGTVGEYIDDNTKNWFSINMGGRPIIDTWWQTETGGALINNGICFPGTKHIIVKEDGKETNSRGFLVQVPPFSPGMLKGIYNDNKKYIETYWTKFKGLYDTNDGAIIENGLIKLTGRTDDVMKVAGHILSSAELENAIKGNKNIVECAVVPFPDQIKGHVPVVFAVLKHGIKSSDNLKKELTTQIRSRIGPFAKPHKIYFVNDLPKTRSGKIMRRILRNLLENIPIEELTAVLSNSEIINKIKEEINIQNE